MAQSGAAIWLVIFAVPWCEHSKELIPQLEAAAAELISLNYNIKFGSVDVSVNKQLGWKYQIDRSPYVKIFFNEDDDWVTSDYNGAGTRSSIFEFCREFYRVKNIPYSNLPEGFIDGDVIELDDSNFDEILFSSNEIWMLTFSAPWCYYCNIMKPNWKAAAAELGADVRFATINADVNRGLARRFFVRTLPTIKFYQAGYLKNDQSAQSYDSGRNYEDILSFSNDLRLSFDNNPELFAYTSQIQEISENINPEVCDIDILDS